MAKKRSVKCDGISDAVLDDSSQALARLDLGRAGRVGVPEAVFAAGKSREETMAIAERLVARLGFALVTRAPEDVMDALRAQWPDGLFARRGMAALVGKPPPLRRDAGFVAIATAGTSDLPVAEEAEVSLRAVGIPTRVYADVGVAGIHRLFEQLGELRRARVVLAVAGMEGALAGVLAGLVEAPLVAVPTSVGYGAAFHGLAALLGMLNSCAPGVATVNIDNGFGAAMLAAKIINSAPCVAGVEAYGRGRK